MKTLAIVAASSSSVGRGDQPGALGDHLARVRGAADAGHALRRRTRWRSSAVGAAPSGGTSPLASEITGVRRGRPARLEPGDHLVEAARGDAEEDVVRAGEPGADRLDAQLARQRDAGQVGACSRGRPRSRAACSGVRAWSVVRKPPRASSTATAVPNEPAPSTTARREPGVGSDSGRGGIGHPDPG